MDIRVLFFARFREKLETDNLDLSLPDEISTTDQLRVWLCDRGAVWQDQLGCPSAVMVAVNQTMVTADHALQPGDEVAFFPPVTGG